MQVLLQLLSFMSSSEQPTVKGKNLTMQGKMNGTGNYLSNRKVFKTSSCVCCRSLHATFYEVGCATRQVARHDLSITLQQLAHLHASRHITVRELFISLLDTVLLTYHNPVPC